MNTYCGLDFGTSNTTIGVCIEGNCRLVPLEREKCAIRSAIFCDEELKQWVFGQAGMDCYLEGAPGRLIMALKSVLGSPLMDDKTVIFNKPVAFTEVLRQFIQHIKSTAESHLGSELTQVVVGRPVHFHDTEPDKDQLAQETVHSILREVGFTEIEFQYEPIAAATTYEKSITQEQLALIVDMGGGTSDFTIIRLHPDRMLGRRSEDLLSNTGVHIAGTDFDHRLGLGSVMPLLGMGSLMEGSSSAIEVPTSFYHDLTTWHMLDTLYTNKTRSTLRSIYTVSYEKKLLSRLLYVLQNKAAHHLLEKIETAKQLLSELEQTQINLDFIERELTTSVSRLQFNIAIEDQIQRIIQVIQHALQNAGIKPHDISAIFYTGGSTKIPLIRNKINALFPDAEVIQGDAFGSVGLGLTLEAQQRFS